MTNLFAERSICTRNSKTITTKSLFALSFFLVHFDAEPPIRDKMLNRIQEVSDYILLTFVRAVEKMSWLSQIRKTEERWLVDKII